MTIRFNPHPYGLTSEQIALAGALAVVLVFGFIIKNSDLCLAVLRWLWRKLGMPSVIATVLGKDTGRAVDLGHIILHDYDRVRHCHIVGSSGGGKTEAMKHLIFADIAAGRGCFIIDAKGDRELYEEVRGFAKSVGRADDLYLVSGTHPDESVAWNPCGLGNQSELQSKFLNANVFSEPFYAKACEHALIQAFNQLVKSKPSGFALPDLVRELKYLADKHKNDTLEGLFHDFGSLVESEWGHILACNPGAGKREINLLDIVQGNKILFVDLPTEGRSIQSSRVGRLLTQELILISGLRKTFPWLNSKEKTFSVYIDEFDAFATESFVTFLNKGRSSNFMIHIAHQTLSDLKKISHEFAGQVLGICNIHLIFRQDDPDDAELWSRFLGTRRVTHTTRQTHNGTNTGQGTASESMEFLVGPDQIKTLRVGECVASVKTKKVTTVTRLPLPRSYRALGKTEQPDQNNSLQDRVRNSLSKPNEKTSAEQVRDLSAENFNVQTDPKKKNVPGSTKWNRIQPKLKGLPNEGDNGYDC